MEDRKQRERDYHNQRIAALNEDIELFQHMTGSSKFYSITRGSQREMYTWINRRAADGQRVLDFACGTGGVTRSISGGAAQLVGIDISDVSVAEALKRTSGHPHEDCINYCVMDAERLAFRDGSFDTVICAGVLHHMDIGKAYSEVHRVLSKPGGAAICVEPLDYNPLFKLYRRMTPHLRTHWESEHISDKSTIYMAGRYFKRIDMRFFHLATLLAVPFRNCRIFGAVLSFLEGVDNILLRLPGIKWLAWQVIYTLHEPRGEMK